MQIILQEDVEKLGNRGELVKVAEGYARNFLLPRKLGPGSHARQYEAAGKDARPFAMKEATEKEAAQKLAELLAAVSLELARKAGENDQLFGSVTRPISPKRSRPGLQVDKRKIVLAEPSKPSANMRFP